jgi:hypothetical protein
VRALASLLFVSNFAFAGAQPAPSSVTELRAGHRVRVDTLLARVPLKAQFVRLRADTLWIRHANTPDSVAFTSRQINRLFVSAGRGSTGQRVLTGALLGAGIGAIIGGVVSPCGECESPGMVGALMIAPVGLVVGALGGAIIGNQMERWKQLPWPP